MYFSLCIWGESLRTANNIPQTVGAFFFFLSLYYGVVRLWMRRIVLVGTTYKGLDVS